MTGALAMLLMVATGMLARVTDSCSPDSRAAFGVLFAAAFFLAAWHPGGAWRRGLMLGLSVPLAHVIAQLTGRPLPYCLDNQVFTLLAMIPAMLGTMVGMAVSRLREPHTPRKKFEPPR